jgi:hypothetical protein
MVSSPLAAVAIVFALLAVPVAPSRAQAGGGHRSIATILRLHLGLSGLALVSTKTPVKLA